MPPGGGPRREAGAGMAADQAPMPRAIPEARLRDAASTSLLSDSATNNRPVSAPATAARASPKLTHGTLGACGARAPLAAVRRARRRPIS
jgi:hypothetical protein